MAFAASAATPLALRSAAAFRSSTAGHGLGRGGAGCQEWTAAAPQYLVRHLSINQVALLPQSPEPTSKLQSPTGHASTSGNSPRSKLEAVGQTEESYPSGVGRKVFA